MNENLLSKTPLCYICMTEKPHEQLQNFCNCNMACHAECLDTWRLKTTNSAAMRACERCRVPYIFPNTNTEFAVFEKDTLVYSRILWMFTFIIMGVTWSGVACTVWTFDKNQRLELWTIGKTSFPWVFYFSFSFLVLFVCCSVCGLILAACRACKKRRHEPASISPAVTDYSEVLMIAIVLGAIFYGVFYFGCVWYRWCTKIINKKIQLRKNLLYAKHIAHSPTVQQV